MNTSSKCVANIHISCSLQLCSFSHHCKCVFKQITFYSFKNCPYFVKEGEAEEMGSQ